MKIHPCTYISRERKCFNVSCTRLREVGVTQRELDGFCGTIPHGLAAAQECKHPYNDLGGMA